MTRVQVASYGQIVGMVFRLYRKRAGVRQADVAQAAQVTPSVWSRIESGRIGLSLVHLEMAAESVLEWPSVILDRAERVRERLEGAEEPLEVVPTLSEGCLAQEELERLAQRYASDLLVLPPLAD
jgi:transcriptional regulator with XRE-family HTH domain